MLFLSQVMLYHSSKLYIKALKPSIIYEINKTNLIIFALITKDFFSIYTNLINNNLIKFTNIN